MHSHDLCDYAFLAGRYEAKKLIKPFINLLDRALLGDQLLVKVTRM